MRWEALFADLEGQFAEADAAELAAEVAERTRQEVSRLALVDRLGASVGRSLRVLVADLGTVGGSLRGLGPDWLLVAENTGHQALLPYRAVVGIDGVAGWSAAPGSQGVVAGRLDLRYTLRALARDRAAVVVNLPGGLALTGTVHRVGADFLELTEHRSAADRAAGPGSGRWVVPLSALRAVRSR